MEKTKSLDNKQTATISLGDFIRIRNAVIPPVNEEEERKKKDTMIKDQSSQRVKNWPDSLEMAKKNKLEQRKKRFVEKEIEKRKIDEEEKKYQEAQKKMVNERANKLLFDAQDQVKSFHSTLLLSDAMKEREFQVEIRERQKDIGKRIEQKWQDVEAQKMIDYDKREKEKEEDEKRKKEYQMSMINQQFKDSKIRRIKDYQDRVVEGEIIKLQAQQELEKERQKEIELRERQEKMKEEFKTANYELEKQKEILRQNEREHERKIEEYSVKKQQMVDLRKRKEEEKFKEKQKQRQMLIDKQAEYLKNLKNREDERIAHQVKEAEEKADKAREEKRRRMEELKRQIDWSRDVQAKRKKDLFDMDKKDERQFVEYWKDKVQLMETSEKLEKDEIKERNMNLQNYLKHQMQQKKDGAIEGFIKDQENAYKTKAILENEEEDFLKYAESWVKEYHSSGKDIKPLMLELKKLKKRNVFG